MRGAFHLQQTGSGSEPRSAKEPSPARTGRSAARSVGPGETGLQERKGWERRKGRKERVVAEIRHGVRSLPHNAVFPFSRLPKIRL